MCAEAVWWQCHRQLIADALVARGVEARHITSARPADAHTTDVVCAHRRSARDLSGTSMRFDRPTGGRSLRPSLGFPTRMTERARFAGSVAADPGDPVRTAGFGMNLVRSLTRSAFEVRIYQI